MQAQQHLGDGRLARTGRADDGRRLPALAGKAEVVQSVLVCIVEAEGGVVEHGHVLGRAVRLRSTRALSRPVHDLGLKVDNGGGTVQARLGARQRERHDLRHHNEEEDEHRVFEHRRDAGDLHRMRAHAVAAQPQQGDLGDVHEEERRAIEPREQQVHLDGAVGIAREDLVQAALGMALLVEGADHAGANDALAQHHVHAVDELLQAHEDGRRLGHRHHGDGEHDGHDHRQQDAHLVVDHARHDDARHRQERNGQHELNRGDDGLLDHVGVVERAGDHGARAEALEIAARELQRRVVDGVADVARHVGREFGRQVRSGHGAAARQQRGAQHGQAPAHDVVEIARADARVDHVGEHRGHQQRAHVIDEEHQQRDRHQRTIGFHESK